MLKKFKYQLILFLVLVVGAVIVQSILNEQAEAELQKQQADLVATHEETVLRIKTGINVYATVVSSIRSFTRNSENFPNEKQLQLFIRDLIHEIDFKDSIVVSWVDTNQVFRYVVTPNAIDPHGLKGSRVDEFRPDFEINMLNALMQEDSVSLYNPINLVEGWAAFPFNFSARNSRGEILGYIAPVLNVKYLLNYTYRQSNDSMFFHRFTLENNIDFSREVVYDGTEVYNKKRDPEYYKNFIQPDTQFITTTVNFYGLDLAIGTAYKNKPSPDLSLRSIAYLWYILLCLFCVVSLIQFLRNNKLNKRVKDAHSQILIKNEQLEKNYNAIQVLMKETHHRVKNNMQIMSSLMNLQSNNLNSEESRSVLEESKSRVQSMALVHQKLYGNEDLTDINVADYVQQLIVYIENTLNHTERSPEKKLRISSQLHFSMDIMIPLGLIINELVTNSYKYAFHNKGDQWIYLKIEEDTELYVLTYSDSGPGIPKHIQPSKSGTLGLELVYLLSDQLDGTIDYTASPLKFVICFKKNK